VVDDYTRLPSTSDCEPVAASQSGFVAGLEAERLGRAAVALGAGRAAVEDRVDPAVGIDVLVPPGERVKAGDPVLMVHHRAGRGLPEAMPLLAAAIQIADQPPPRTSIVVEEVR
jgi:pyrimidine-nucleoside phosphorylase/thymidine phosphorylase